MRGVVATALLAGILTYSPAALAQVEKKEFNVIGTWNFLTNWQKLEVPFWTVDLPAASGGNIKTNLKSVTEVKDRKSVV